MDLLRYAVSTEEDLELTWKLDVCKESLCLLDATSADNLPELLHGTGWVVRNDGVAALVTARHVVQHNVAADEGALEEVITGTLTAKFQGGRVVDLSGARVLLVPAGESGGVYEPPDVAIILLPVQRRFPVRPVPCLLDASSAGDIGGAGECALLHHPGGCSEPVVFPRGQVIVGESSGSTVVPPWVVQYLARTDVGSSGGMLVDAQCRAFGVHFGASSIDETKSAVLLSVVHARLGSASPWNDLVPVVHERVLSFHLPPQPPHLVVRVEALNCLQRHVVERGMAVVASTGLPGVGKSFLAVDWAHRQRLAGSYSVIAWLRSERVADCEADFVTLGDYLGLPLDIRPDQSRRERALWVKSYLEMHPGRGTLLVFDNAVNYRDLKAFVPTHNLCRCVFTARDQSKFPDGAVLPLDAFTQKESLALLRMASQRNVDHELDAAADLCAEVGHLPLAVHVLAAYTKRSGQDFATVLRTLRLSVASDKTLTTPELADYERPESVVGALLLACGELDKANRGSLQRLSMLAPDRVPVNLLGVGSERDRLLDLAIISAAGDGLVRTHRLVQHVSLAQMTVVARRRVADALVEDLLAMTEDFSDSKPDTWGSFRVATPHAESLLDKMDGCGNAGRSRSAAVVRLWNLLGTLRMYHTCTGALSSALHVADVLAEDLECYLGPADKLTTAAHNNKANLLQELGRTDEALELIGAVERQLVAEPGQDHPDLTSTLHSKAVAFVAKGKYNEALELYRQVERMEVAALGENHIGLATTRHNMAGVLHDLGKIDEALAMHQAMERLRVAALGEDHLDVAKSRHSIAGVLQAQGKYDQALALFREVSQKRSAALGDEHLDVAAAQHGVASILSDLDEHKDALDLFRDVLRVRVAALGEDHPLVASTQYMVGGELHSLGKYEEALPLLRDVERKRVAALGDGHRDVASTQNSIACVLRRLGRSAEALVLYRSVEQKEVASLGGDHFNVAVTRHNMAILLQRMGRRDEAVGLAQVAADSATTALGASHPNVLLMRQTLEDMRAASSSSVPPRPTPPADPPAC
eukprot:TRINITY_DN163_c0_g1_i7.p1 TRINITY_DN163_c0_g1~~TRINITY_DN163_c0_g1_i7.p1  ORF type:complete len:1045 (-),score=242.50 TRINITY_DN163_c0_g1_i7:311-3445(-)